MNHRLEIPSETDPQWTSLILSCWETYALFFPFAFYGSWKVTFFLYYVFWWTWTSQTLIFIEWSCILLPVTFSDDKHILAVNSDSQLRPSFQQLLERLRELQRQYNVQTQMQRNASAAAKNSSIEEWMEIPYEANDQLTQFCRRCSDTLAWSGFAPPAWLLLMMLIDTAIAEDWARRGSCLLNPLGLKFHLQLRNSDQGREYWSWGWHFWWILPWQLQFMPSRMSTKLDSVTRRRQWSCVDCSDDRQPNCIRVADPDYAWKLHHQHCKVQPVLLFCSDSFSVTVTMLFRIPSEPNHSCYFDHGWKKYGIVPSISHYSNFGCK